MALPLYGTPRYDDRTEFKVHVLRRGQRKRIELDVHHFGAATIAIDCGLAIFHDSPTPRGVHDQPVVQIELDHPYIDTPAAVAMSVDEACALSKQLDRMIKHAKTRGGLI